MECLEASRMRDSDDETECRVRQRRFHEDVDGKDVYLELFRSEVEKRFLVELLSFSASSRIAARELEW